MKPQRDHQRGTYVIDRVIPGMDRLKVASGTNDARTFKLLLGMVESLKAGGRLDILRAIKDRIVTPLEVWDAFRVSDLDRLANAETIRLLWPTARDTDAHTSTGALDNWRATFHASVKHKASIKVSFDQLRKISRADANVGDLPDLVVRYRKVCDKAGHGRSFNLARSHVQAYLRDTLGRSHRLYKKVADTKPLPVERSEGNPLTVAELDALVKALPPKAAAAAHDMAMTGMRPGEFWGRWEALGDRVKVRGTKTKGSRRVVPLVAPVGPPQLSYRAFAQTLDRKDAERTPYDFRRTFAHLLEEAGVPRTRRRLYLGHSAGDVTDLYERHEVDSYLTADAAKVRAYLENARAHTTEHTTEDQ